MARGLRAGLSVGEFWDLTPKELDLVLEAAGWRRREARRRDAWLAWHVAGLMRTRQMPPLSALMPRESPPVSPRGRGENGGQGEDVTRRKAEHAEMVARMGGNLGPRRAVRSRKKRKRAKRVNDG